MPEDPNFDLTHLIDRAVKALFRECPTLVTRLAGLTVAAETIRVEDPNLNLPELRADHVFILPEEAGETGRPECAIYLEYQLHPDPRLLPSWVAKWGGLTRQLGMPVVLLVLYLQKGDYATFPAQYEVQVGAFRTELQFTAIRLWEQTARIRSGELPELAPLLLLSEANSTERTLREEADLIRRTELPPVTKADLLGLVLMVASRRFSREWLRTLFREEIETMHDAGLVGDWIMEGEARGEAVGTRKTVLRYLVKRFGTLPKTLLDKIEGADTDGCNLLLDRATEAESLAEFADLYSNSPE